MDFKAVALATLYLCLLSGEVALATTPAAVLAPSCDSRFGALLSSDSSGLAKNGNVPANGIPEDFIPPPYKNRSGLSDGGAFVKVSSFDERLPQLTESEYQEFLRLPGLQKPIAALRERFSEQYVDSYLWILAHRKKRDILEDWHFSPKLDELLKAIDPTENRFRVQSRRAFLAGEKRTMGQQIAKDPGTAEAIDYLEKAGIKAEYRFTREELEILPDPNTEWGRWAAKLKKITGGKGKLLIEHSANNFSAHASGNDVVINAKWLKPGTNRLEKDEIFSLIAHEFHHIQQGRRIERSSSPSLLSRFSFHSEENAIEFDADYSGYMRGDELSAYRISQNVKRFQSQNLVKEKKGIQAADYHMSAEDQLGKVIRVRQTMEKYFTDARSQISSLRQHFSVGAPPPATDRGLKKQLYLEGKDGARVRLYSEEVPLLDGSMGSKNFVEMKVVGAGGKKVDLHYQTMESLVDLPPKEALARLQAIFDEASGKVEKYSNIIYASDDRARQINREIALNQGRRRIPPSAGAADNAAKNDIAVNATAGKKIDHAAQAENLTPDVAESRRRLREEYARGGAGQANRPDHSFGYFKSDIKEFRDAHPEMSHISDEELFSFFRYDGEGYGKINEALRAGDQAALEQEKDVIGALGSLLEKLPKFEGTVSRYVSQFDPQVLQKYKPGSVISMPGFTSGMARSVADLPKGSITLQSPQMAFMRIKSKTAADVSNLATIVGGPGSGNDVLFRRGTKFKVVGVSEIENPYFAKNPKVNQRAPLIELEEI